MKMEAKKASRSLLNGVTGDPRVHPSDAAKCHRLLGRQEHRREQARQDALVVHH